ncbi:MAG: hypothetical protein EBZ77_04630 [Chitinophagia bacterium]|nr:hypothetical protein [Chitinophagia bacterium]
MCCVATSASAQQKLLLATDTAKGADTGKVKIVPVDPYKAATYLHPIPFNRQYFHEDKIDREIRKADKDDGYVDNIIRYKGDTTLSGIFGRAILRDASFLQIMVENMPANGRDSFEDNQERIRCLNAIARLIYNYNLDPSPDAYYYRDLVKNMHDLLIAYNEDKLWSFTIKNTNKYTLENSRLLFENHKDVRAYLYSQMGSKDPRMMIRRLPEYAYDTFANGIISAAAKLEPELIFSYATSISKPITYAIHHSDDPYVQAIVDIADHSKNSVKAMAFLGDIYYHRKTVAEIDEIINDPQLLFQNLIRLRLENDSIGRSSYTNELEIRAIKYVREMNELHESPDAVRFKCLENLSAVELFYVIVYGQDEIYTSSFLGSYKRLIEKMKPMPGNQLLDSVHNDHFRTFVRMCAGYNTLSDFLTTMSDTARSQLMNNFISNLQKGADDDLEDAVDVADAFGSITDTALATFLQARVKENYELSYQQRSKKGMYIYSILSRLFDGNRVTSSDTGANLVAARLGLTNINKVPNSLLINDSGVVYQQVFFYGDEDGMHSYEHFLDLFRKDKRWKISTQQYWSVITSTTPGKVVIYANLPLPAPQDDDAIAKLARFLSDTGIQPTIMIHRGHSYHLKTTLGYLQKQVKIVILGSCGGYHNLALVLNRSPDAHIVSSKQTGTMGVNDEILRSMNNALVAGQDPNWINMWHGLEEYFLKKRDAAEKDKFSDYVPPHKNLGAIFIKAYRRLMASTAP